MLSMRDLIPWTRSRDLAAEETGYEHPFLAFHREVNRLFDDFWRGDLPLAGRFERGRTMVAPRIDVVESEKEIVVTAELPGMTEDDVEVLLGDDTLTIKGEKKSEHEEGEGGYRYMERAFGSFRRTLPIDAGVLTDKIDAAFKNGVLTVTLPKNPEVKAKTRKIAVKGEHEKAKVEKKAA